jgi:hypothetical protein
MCKFIKYARYTIGQVLATSKPHYYTKSVILQLEKNDRHFVYYVKLISPTARKFKWLSNNGRLYKIHINLHKKATNFDIMKSYYFARLLDIELYEK